jgi:hypothetical protein
VLVRVHYHKDGTPLLKSILGRSDDRTGMNEQRTTTVPLDGNGPSRPMLVRAALGGDASDEPLESAVTLAITSG